MSTPAPAPPRRRRWRRVLLWTGAAFLLALVSLYLLRGPLFARPLGRWVAAELSRQLGGEFSAEGVRGAWFADAVLVELRTERAPDRGPLAGLSWRRLEVTYGILDLLRGRPLSGLHSLRIDWLAIDLDFARPAGEAKAGSPRPRGNPLADLPARLPALELRGSLRARLPLRDGVGTLAIASFALVSDGPETDLDCSDLSLPELGIAQPRWSARLVRDGPAAFHLEGREDLAGIALRRLAIAAEAGGATVVDATIGVGGGEVVGEARDGAVGARLAGLDCARLPPWLARLIELPTRGVIDGRGTVRRTASAWEGDGELRVRDLAWRGFDARAIAFDGSWDGRTARVRTFELDSDLAHARVRGLEVEPHGAWLARAPETCSLNVPDCATLLSRLGIALPAALRGRGPIALELSAAGQGAHLDPLTVKATGAGVEASVVGAADLPPGDDWHAISVSAQWRVKLDATAFPGLGAGWAGAVDGDGHVDGELGQPRARFHLAGHGLKAAGAEIGEVTAAGSAAWPVLELEQAELAQPAGRVSLSGSFDAAARTMRAARLSLDVDDLAKLVRALPGLPRLAGSAHGEVTVDAVALGHPLAALREAHATATVDGDHLIVGERTLGRLALDARLADGHLEVGRAELDGPVHVAVAGDADLAANGGITAHFTRLDAAVPSLPAAYLRLRDPTNVAYEPAASRWHVGPASFEAVGGRVDIALDLGERLDATVRALRVRPWSLLPAWAPSIDGDIDCAIAARGDPLAPEASLHVRSVGLRVADQGALVAIDAEQDAAGIRIPRFDLRIADALTANLSGALPAQLGRAGVRAVPGIPRLNGHVFGALAPGLLPKKPGIPEVGCAEATVAVDQDGARADLAVRELLVSIPPLDELSKPPPDSIAELDLHGEAGPRGWRARIAARDSGGLAVEGEGEGRAAFDPQRPWAFLAALREDDLAGRMTLARLELERGAALLPQLVRMSGVASGELRVSGRPFQPRWNGELALDQVGLKARSDLPAIVDGRGRLRLEGTRVTVEALSAKLGYAPVTLTGSVDLSDLDPAFDLELKGANVLLARNQYLRLRADCDLKLHGPIEALELGGEVRLTDALYSRPIELLSRLRPSGGHKVKQEGVKLFSIREGPLSTMRFDVGISGTGSFHVRTNVFRGDCSLDMHLGGTGESPLPRGRAWTEDARLRMPFTTISVAQATVLFPPDNPYVPRLDGEGEAKLKGYDLRVHAHGDLPDIEVTVDSDPPLTTSEGVMLLTTGMTGNERQEPGAQRTELTMVGKYFAKEVWHEVSGPGDPDKEAGLLDLDRLDISIGQQLSQTGQDTIDADYELSSHFFLHGERDIFDDYNLGLIWRIRRH